ADVFGPMLKELLLKIPPGIRHLGEKPDAPTHPVFDLSSLLKRPVGNHCSKPSHQPTVFMPSHIDLTGTEWFVGGDLPWLHMILGLQACNSTFFCCQCLADRTALHQRPYHHPIAGNKQSRSLSNLQRDSSKYSNTTKTQHEAIKYHNAVNPPLVPFEIKGHVVPPSLHMAIGLTMDLHNEIEKLCKERDEMVVKQGLTSLADLTY